MLFSLSFPGNSATLSQAIVSSLHQAIEDCISQASGRSFAISDQSSLGGGCIHDAARITGEDGRSFFAKRNSIDHLPSFEAEAFALDMMAATRTIRVPRPLGTCSAGRQAALVLEYLPMGGRGGDWQAMGRQLALLHRHTGKQHGWDHDNWIGSTPQINTPCDGWIEFYLQFRFQPQVRWARQRGLRLADAEALADVVPAFFSGYDPLPSLIHGDLWAGNAGFLEDGTPVIFDPAAYHGDREAELAMTEMFGGYPAAFYEGYASEWPLDPGYATRKQLYLLYHTLNHYNLFGGGYGSQSESIIRRLLQSAS
jgi:fructosamine-3-kinase